jgi:two-component system, NtrC family, sensor kinase
MNRNFRFYFLSSLLITAGVSGTAGIGVGLWTFLDGSGAGTLVLRGLITLVLVCLLALATSLFLARSLTRPLQELSQTVAQMRAGGFRVDPRPESPSEIVELAADLRELGAALEERDRLREQDAHHESRKYRREALNRFGRGVAREVQKSLAGVIGFVEIALRQPGVEGQLKNYLTLLDQEARSGREALERILRYMREEDFPTEALDVNTLLLETSRGFMDSLEKDRVQVQLNLAQDLPRVMGDAGQLKHVLSSLIENAREAMVPEGGLLELSTNLNQEQRVVVMVKDTGRGIPKEDHPRVFTPFFTSKGNLKGAGLSLSISERIISQHGGHLDFWSTVGEGSVFFVTLPPLPPA